MESQLVLKGYPWLGWVEKAFEYSLVWKELKQACDAMKDFILILGIVPSSNEYLAFSFSCRLGWNLLSSRERKKILKKRFFFILDFTMTNVNERKI